MSGFGGTIPEVPFTFNTALQAASSTSTYTFNDAFIGQALQRRLVVAYVSMRATSNRDFSSMSIAGVSATQIVESFGDNAGITWRTALYYASVTSGEQTGTITVNFTGAVQRCTVGLWSLYGYSSTPKSSGTKNSNSYPAINFAAKDIGIFGQHGYSDPVEWTNANVDYNIYDDPNAGDREQVSGASYRATSAETRTVSNDISTVDVYACYAVFGAL